MGTLYRGKFVRILAERVGVKLVGAGMAAKKTAIEVVGARSYCEDVNLKKRRGRSDVTRLSRRLVQGGREGEEDWRMLTAMRLIEPGGLKHASDTLSYKLFAFQRHNQHLPTLKISSFASFTQLPPWHLPLSSLQKWCETALLCGTMTFAMPTI